LCSTLVDDTNTESAIKIAHNLVQHYREKSIHVRHVSKGDNDLTYVHAGKQLTDIFTKPLDEKTFFHLRSELNILDASNVH
jgi:hypothetical protein